MTFDYQPTLRSDLVELRPLRQEDYGALYEVAFDDISAVQDLVNKTKDMEEFLRRALMRRGLNVLCTAQKPKDLQRIRANLRGGYTEASKLDAVYLARHGEWTDIPLLANAKGLSSLEGELQVEVASAITSIGKKHSISDLLSLEMPAYILKKIIELCPESRFAKISRAALFSLFNHESAEVRKAAAALAVRSHSARRIKSTLHEYLSRGEYRYYNVIHWLDLGASMRRDDARKVARAASEAFTVSS